MIISFYSYKGGVGRTQLIANLAAYFCYRLNKKVLLIDWDLEAPGLHSYFNIKPKDIKKGFMDLFFEYVALMRKKNHVSEQLISENNLFPNQEIILKPINHKNGCIHLITAGNYNVDYFKKINSFDWNNFYDHLDGKVYIELLKKNLKNLDYDYILIDSRTGVNDYSGICNIQMPDLNMIILAPNNQNFEGALRMSNYILDSPYTSQFREKAIVLPILSRTDGDSKYNELFLNRFHNEFGFLLKNLLKHVVFKENSEEYYEKTKLIYSYSIASGENILFSEKDENLTDLVKKYIYIADLIEDINKIAYQNQKIVGKILLPIVPLEKLKEEAQKFYDERNYNLAIEKYLQILQREEPSFYLLNKISLIYADKGDFSKALEFQLNAQKYLNENNEQYQSDLAQSFNNLSLIHKALGDFPKAKEFLLKAIKIGEKDFEKNQKDLATAYNNLSMIYLNLVDLPKALEFQLKAIEIREKVLDKTNPDFAQSYNNLSLIYKDLGDLPKALEFQLKAIEILDKNFDKNHQIFASYYNNLSTIYKDLGDLINAKEFQLKALEIKKQALDKNHPSLATSYSNLAAIYHQTNDKSKALEFINKAIKILEYNFPNGHPNLEKSKKLKESIEKM